MRVDTQYSRQISARSKMPLQPPLPGAEICRRVLPEILSFGRLSDARGECQRAGITLQHAGLPRDFKMLVNFARCYQMGGTLASLPDARYDNIASTEHQWLSFDY